MKLIVDDEAKQAVENLCDAALRIGGLANRGIVNAVIEGMKEIPKSGLKGGTDDE